jgi:acyl dehydratase
MPKYYLEDFIPGSVTSYGGVRVDRDAMLSYARAFDAQPMHIDEALAKNTMAGELIASGWYTASLNMRMMADDFILNSASMGSPGVGELKWLKPVKAGDHLHGRRHILDRRASVTKPDRGLVTMRHQVFNQRDEMVLEQTNLIMFGRRGRDALRDALNHPVSSEKAAPTPALPAFHDVAHETIPFFEELAVGERLNLGEVHFDETSIIEFAKDFDPQYFHIDPVAAKDSNFGGLAASGWHTASSWMGQMVQSRMTATTMALSKGKRPARLGPSPGFTNLRWIKPVYAGDTIRYTSAVIEKRESASRPEWGIVHHYNTGTNQRGDEVFSFSGVVFWERLAT